MSTTNHTERASELRVHRAVAVNDLGRVNDELDRTTPGTLRYDQLVVGRAEIDRMIRRLDDAIAVEERRAARVTA